MWSCELTSQTECTESRKAEVMSMKLGKEVTSRESLQPLKSNNLMLVRWNYILTFTRIVDFKLDSHLLKKFVLLAWFKAL